MDEQIGLNQSEIGSLPFVQLPLIVLADRSLNHGAKMVYVALLTFFYQKSFCYPKVNKIAQLTNLSRRTVQEHLAQLEDRGLIRREIVPGKVTVYHRDEHLDLYTKGNGVLSDEAIKILADAGVTDQVERIGEERKERQRLGLKGALSDTVDDTAVIEKRDVDTALELPRSQASPRSRAMKLEEATAKAKSTARRTEAAHKKRKARREKMAQLAPDENVEKAKQLRKQERDEARAARGAVLTVRDVEAEWKLAVKKKWPSVLYLQSDWTPAHYGMAKRLCDVHGYDLVIQAIVAIIEDWEDFVDRYGVRGYPSLKVMVAYADSWIPEATGGKIEPQTARSRSMGMGEYDETRGSKKGGISYFD